MKDSTKTKVLVVEDEPGTSNLIRSLLEQERYAVTVAETLFKARGLLARSAPDLLVLDRHLPDGDGAELCRELRTKPETRRLPILMLTARKSLADKVEGLNLGGDDYLTKPFNPEELLARVEALLRRRDRSSVAETKLVSAGLELFVEGRAVTVDGKPVSLTAKEFDMLKMMLERPGRVLTRTAILEHVWGYGADVELDTKAVDMAMVGLRRKLGRWGERVETVRGHGYRLRPEEP